MKLIEISNEDGVIRHFKDIMRMNYWNCIEKDLYKMFCNNYRKLEILQSKLRRNRIFFNITIRNEINETLNEFIKER
ncbi:MAG: hypothetical protein PHF86_12940 [Candidatus Nanoarchaeia archaeon]|jgi:hypothetical protein|nr:hypothetical protein [Candidatus Nanoarchaeia archaeon]